MRDTPATTPYLLPPVPLRSLDDYFSSDWGGLGLQRAVELGPEATCAEVERSGLRGRGGGGFPTGRKWAGVRAQPGTHRYVVVNGAEGEPGTFKDRAILRANPYQVIEGLLIAAFAVDAIETFIALKQAFVQETERVTAAVEEMQRAGICRNCPVTVVQGPDAYLFGEEKAMLEVIEGNEPLPRVLPPYEHGLFANLPQAGWEAKDPEPGHAGLHESNPTLVNNVETLANVPLVMARGADWYRTMGTDASPGHIVCTIVGDVRSAGVQEVELGTPLREVIHLVSDGPNPERTVKAVFSGVANPVVPGDQLDVPVSYEGFAAIGSGMGAGGFIVYDDTACMVEVARLFSRFLYVESCAQCPPCKEGARHVTALLELFEAGSADVDDAREIQSWLAKVTDGNRCYLPVEEQKVVGSILETFVGESGDSDCPVPRRSPLPNELRDRTGQVVPELYHVLEAYDAVADADVVHDHTLAGAFIAPGRAPVIVTNHGPFDPMLRRVFAAIAERAAVIAISHAQARTAEPGTVRAVIHHGVDPEAIPIGSGSGGYLAHVSRMTPDKGITQAIDLAQAVGLPLAIAGKCQEPEEIEYFDQVVRPMLGADIDYLGEVTGSTKYALMGEAIAFVNPIQWEEPFGLAMIESLATGTPVIATRRGAAPEIVDNGTTGWLGDSFGELTEGIQCAATLDRTACRRAVEARFSTARMVRDHLDLYRALLAPHELLPSA